MRTRSFQEINLDILTRLDTISMLQCRLRFDPFFILNRISRAIDLTWRSANVNKHVNRKNEQFTDRYCQILFRYMAPLEFSKCGRCRRIANRQRNKFAIEIFSRELIAFIEINPCSDNSLRHDSLLRPGITHTTWRESQLLPIGAGDCLSDECVESSRR